MNDRGNVLILGVSMVLGFAALGYLIGSALIDFKEYERTVAVKGLSEREVPADIVIWPITFTAASNDLADLYAIIEVNTKAVREYLLSKGIDAAEITNASPSITDKSAQQYGGSRAEFRFAANQAVTVYSKDIPAVRQAMADLAELGKRGVVLTGGDYENQVEYLFTGLNEIKPEMIEEATRMAREVAQKFAEDSDSELGKIKQARQGQFSIVPRDRNNPHIKNVRVVSTVEYYLSD